jgi:hypothetical protein
MQRSSKTAFTSMTFTPLSCTAWGSTTKSTHTNHQPRFDHRFMKHCYLVLIACTLALLTGCGDKPASTSTSQPTAVKAQGTIGVSLLTLDNPFFKVKKRGYEAIVVSGDKDVAKQGNQIKDFIVKKVSAIVLSPCDSKSIIPVIQEANAAGIPVFTVDIPCNEPGVKIVTQIATDNYGGGKEAGQAMIEALGEAGGKIAVLHFKPTTRAARPGSTSSLNSRAAGQRTWVTRRLRMRCRRIRICAASSPSTIPRRSARARHWRRPARRRC